MIATEKSNPDKTTLTATGSQKKLQILFKPPTERHSNENSTWQRFKEVFGRNTRSNVGTCMVVFAVPLLIPGITLTAVAFDDETGFNKYGVLHVLGMVMLSLASVLIIVGILLNITFENEVSPGNSLHSLSTHGNSGQGETKNRVTQSQLSNASHVEESTPDTIEATVSKPQVTFMVASSSNTQRENHVQVKSEVVGAFPPLTNKPSLKQNVSLVGVNNGYVSSSDDDSSEDTDNRSSGSYVLPQESEVAVSSGIYYGDERNGSNLDENHLRQVLHGQGNYRDNIGCEYSIAKLGKIPPIESSNSKSSHESQNSIQPNNFFQHREEVKRPNNLSIGSGNALRISRHKNNTTFGETDRIPLTAVSYDSPSNLTSSPSIQNSPRARLGGFSNASALASSLHMSNSDELLPKHLGVESFGSNVSVFSHEDEAKEGREQSNSHIMPECAGDSKFTFDLTQNHQAGSISQRIGPAVMEDHKKAEFTAKSILMNTLPPKLLVEGTGADRFHFHARTENAESLDSCDVTDDHNISSMTKVHRKSSARRSKKRQAFSFPQGRSSPPNPLPPPIRQSAPASLPVSAQVSKHV